MPTGGLAAWLVPLLWKTAASFAMNVITNKVFGKKQANTSPTYSIGTLQTQCNSNQVMPLIYGRVKCAGNSLWQDGSGKTVNRLVGFSLGKNYGVSDVRLDDVDINTLTGCNYTAYMGDGVQAIDGRVTGADQTAKAKLVGGMKYDAYLAFSITASDKISSNPNVTAIWQGRIVKVYSTPTEYTEAWSNNVWCILDFMTSPDGCNIPADNIDIQSFIDAAAYAQPGDGSRDWQLNLILDEKKSRQDWLNEMMLCFRAYRTYQNGKHGLLIDKPEPVSQIFTVKSTESIQIDWQELSEDVERIILKYPDPDYEWQNVGAPATMPAPFRNGTPLTKTVEIHGVTNFKQASQLSWFYLNQAQTCGEYITYTCNKRALNRTIGDVIGIYDPITKRTEPGLAYKRYRIMAMTEPQGMSIQLYCREYNADLYNDTQGSVKPVVSVSKLPNTTTTPPAITNLTATEYGWAMTNGVHVSNIDLSFTASNYFDTVSYLISISEDNGETWRYINTISSTTYRIENVANGSYIVGIQPVNKAGIIGAKMTVPIVVVGKDASPADVETLMVETLASGVKRLSWAYTYPTPNDIAGFRLKYNMGNSIWWQTAIPLHSGLILASPFETANLPSGTVTVMVVAVDNAGNESVNPAYAIIGLGDAVVDNVLYEADLKGVAWDGAKTNCHVDGDGNLVADDSGDKMYSADNNALYLINANELFYVTTWPEMTYEQSAYVDCAGLLSLAKTLDGNVQMYYRRQFPFLIYGTDYDPFFPADDTLIFREGPWSMYTDKVETIIDIHQFKAVIPSGKLQGIIKQYSAIVDVPDKVETLNDVSISASGTQLPITKDYIRIKNVNVTIQDTGTTAMSARCVSKDKDGPVVILVNKDNVQVAGMIDVTIQGY